MGVTEAMDVWLQFVWIQVGNIMLREIENKAENEMIDLQYAKKAFENYLNDYDRKNEKILLYYWDYIVTSNCRAR